jgi:putative intracellular protease/amidase/DNA-directed RNA polymerase subunit RPC12/RpoP
MAKTGLAVPSLIGEPSANIAADSYICPPCGQPCDKLTFDKPGQCPECEMTLIHKSELESVPTVAILLFDRAEIIDFGGPWEVFGGAGYKVFTVAEKMDPVNCVYGQRVSPDYTFDNSPPADILLVPGGGVSNAVHNQKLIKWVAENAQKATHVLTVCTGAFIAAEAGLLDGLTATTVRGGIDQLAAAGKNIKTVHDKRYVDNGKIITTAGLSSGIDGALHLVSKIDGVGTAQLVALGIEYNWDPDGKFARAALADRYLPNMNGFKWKVLSSSGDVDRWEFMALVTGPALAADILSNVGKQIAASTPHAQGAVTMTTTTASQDRPEIGWKFRDESGRAWKGSGYVTTASDKGKFVLTLKLARG